MTTGSTCLRGIRIAAALLVLTFTVTGCGRPPDEVWLRFLGFKQGGSTISIFQDTLREESTATVDVDFENRSLYVGQQVGTGILVNQARIDYRMAGFSPPSAEYPVNLYLPPPADGAATTGTLTSFPLAPDSLKNWLINTGAFEDSASEPVVELTARVTFYGSTDEGTPLETEGSIRIALTNTGGTTSETIPTVYIVRKNDADKSDGINGEFTVVRNGSTATSLNVYFTDGGGTATSTDYNALISPVNIPALAGSAIVKVIPKAGGVTGVTVKITLDDHASYTVIDPGSAQLTISP